MIVSDLILWLCEMPQGAEVLNGSETSLGTLVKLMNIGTAEVVGKEEEV